MVITATTSRVMTRASEEVPRNIVAQTMPIESEIAIYVTLGLLAICLFVGIVKTIREW